MTSNPNLTSDSYNNCTLNPMFRLMALFAYSVHKESSVLNCDGFITS